MGSWEDLLTDDKRGSHAHLRSRDEGPQDAAGPVVGDLRKSRKARTCASNEVRYPLSATGSAGQEPQDCPGSRRGLPERKQSAGCTEQGRLG